MTCPDCDIKMILTNEGSFVCDECGRVGDQCFVHEFNNTCHSVTNISATVYKRFKYFAKLVRNISGKNIPDVDTINLIKKTLQGKPFNEINQLRKLFRLNGLSKYYEYIYYYWYIIKGYYLIPLSMSTQRRLTEKFENFERKYCYKYPQKRNIINYSFLIKKFMTEIGLSKYCKYLKQYSVQARINSLNKIYKELN